MKFSFFLKRSALFIARNRLFCLRLAVMGMTAYGAAMPHTAFAAYSGAAINMPYRTAAVTLYEQLTGPIPMIGGTVAVATGGMMYMLGEGQMTRTAIRICIGAGIAMLSPQVIDVFVGSNAGDAGVLF